MLSSIDSYRQMEYDYDYFHDDLTDLLDPNALDDYYPDYSLESVSFLEYTRACLQPTLYDVCTTYFPVLCICFLFHCFNKFGMCLCTCISEVFHSIQMIYSFFIFSQT